MGKEPAGFQPPTCRLPVAGLTNLRQEPGETIFDPVMYSVDVAKSQAKAPPELLDATTELELATTLEELGATELELGVTLELEGATELELGATLEELGAIELEISTTELEIGTELELTITGKDELELGMALDELGATELELEEGLELELTDREELDTLELELTITTTEELDGLELEPPTTGTEELELLTTTAEELELTPGIMDELEPKEGSVELELGLELAGGVLPPRLSFQARMKAVSLRFCSK
jgi:hypothetical protein